MADWGGQGGKKSYKYGSAPKRLSPYIGCVLPKGYRYDRHGNPVLREGLSQSERERAQMLLRCNAKRARMERKRMGEEHPPVSAFTSKRKALAKYKDFREKGFAKKKERSAEMYRTCPGNMRFGEYKRLMRLQEQQQEQQITGDSSQEQHRVTGDSSQMRRIELVSSNRPFSPSTEAHERDDCVSLTDETAAAVAYEFSDADANANQPISVRITRSTENIDDATTEGFENDDEIWNGVEGVGDWQGPAGGGERMTPRRHRGRRKRKVGNSYGQVVHQYQRSLGESSGKRGMRRSEKWREGCGGETREPASEQEQQQPGYWRRRMEMLMNEQHQRHTMIREEESQQQLLDEQRRESREESQQQQLDEQRQESREESQQQQLGEQRPESVSMGDDGVEVLWQQTYHVDQSVREGDNRGETEVEVKEEVDESMACEGASLRVEEQMKRNQRDSEEREFLRKCGEFLGELSSDADFRREEARLKRVLKTIDDKRKVREEERRKYEHLHNLQPCPRSLLDGVDAKERAVVELIRASAWWGGKRFKRCGHYEISVNTYEKKISQLITSNKAIDIDLARDIMFRHPEVFGEVDPCVATDDIVYLTYRHPRRTVLDVGDIHIHFINTVAHAVDVVKHLSQVSRIGVDTEGFQTSFRHVAENEREQKRIQQCWKERYMQERERQRELQQQRQLEQEQHMQQEEPEWVQNLTRNPLQSLIDRKNTRLERNLPPAGYEDASPPTSPREDVVPTAPTAAPEPEVSAVDCSQSSLTTPADTAVDAAAPANNDRGWVSGLRRKSDGSLTKGAKKWKKSIFEKIRSGDMPPPLRSEPALIETVFSGIRTVQLAPSIDGSSQYRGHVYVFFLPIGREREYFEKYGLRSLLENDSIEKFFCGGDGDITELSEVHGCNVRNTHDVQRMAADLFHKVSNVDDEGGSESQIGWSSNTLGVVSTPFQPKFAKIHDLEEPKKFGQMFDYVDRFFDRRRETFRTMHQTSCDCVLYAATDALFTLQASVTLDGLLS